MGDSKLCLLLLLSTSALAFAQDEDQTTCLLAKRYKTLHKYKYQYESESLNAINGASALMNGPKASCTVEIEVPQTCSFILRTTGCSLSEVVDTDAEGNPVFSPASSSDTFAAEMEKYLLKFAVRGVHDVKLYPEDGETTTILNIKRAVISALAVPLLEEDKNKNMPTIHGKCKTYYKVNTREDIATDISLQRDLSRCDKFVPMRDHTSPLALISGLHYPLAQLVRSSQTCNYKFDNKKKHMTSGSCTEEHLLVPFSHNGQYGVVNIGKQQLTLVQVSPYNDRIFDHGDTVKGLHMDAVDDKSAVQDNDSVLKLLTELSTLPDTDGERRAHLFHKIVTMVRGMKTETLSPTIPEALAVSHALTYQVLAQCGTPECSSAIMQILRTSDSSSPNVDAAVFAMGLLSNPSAHLIYDMLEMAKFRSSKPIMYALSNVVKRFYKNEGKLIPEIHSVAEFMAAQLGDCSGDDKPFMTLRVIGNMAPAVLPASAALRNAVIQCVTQPAASSAVQQAAIQVYRLTPIPEESRGVLMKVLLDSTSPMQKRIAAYLVLMKDPKPSELVQLIDALHNEQDIQVKNFVISHINNILTSAEPDTHELRQKIHDALQGNEVGSVLDPTKFSRNYKIGSVEGNMIFEGNSYLPKEVMLDMTLKAFGFDIDMMEIGLEGKGFEPTVDALFGENGFFPDTAMKTMYFVSDNMPLSVNEILHNVLPGLGRDRMKRQASQNLIKEIGHNLNKLVKELKTSQSPEAMVYLKLLGNELGYLKTNEIEGMAYSGAMIIESMFKMFPTDFITALMTKSDNTIFAHYIFMDNEFFLPTLTGVPLKIALSGTFTPGIKGGLKIARDMSEVTFMPSAGVEFVTQIGSHIPEYVNSGLEMHTNLFHEKGLSAKISVARDQVKLTIPAPTRPTKLIKMTNTLVAVTGSEVKTIPTVMDKVQVNKCSPIFTGMKYCAALQYTDAFAEDTAPYFPLTGDSKFALELHPTGEVTEYTATIAYELLREGEEGRQKVDSVKLILKAEGAEPTEATATMKYNRKKNMITAELQIPDYDVEAGLRLGVVDGNTKGKGTHSIYLDFVNHNIPQLSLVGRANLKAMKDGMLQVQLLVPSVKVDTTVTAKMKYDEEVEVELKSEIKFMDAMSEQKILMSYDASKVKVQVKSDVNTKTNTLHTEVFEKYGNKLLDTQVGQTDMKVRHIYKKFVEAANNYMEKYGADIPYLENFRVPDMPEISLPEKLFLNTEAMAVYHFNKEYFTITIPVPLGGKSTKDLNFPPALTTPTVSLPEFGLQIVSMEIPIPEFVIPESIHVFIPLFGKAELSTLMRSNLYNMETSMAVGKDIVEIPSYSAKFNMEGTSPIDILSIKFEGSGMLAATDSIKAQLKSSLAHKFLDASISIVEDSTITDKIILKSSSKIEATSPLGLNFALEHIGVVGINTNEFSINNNFEGMINAGPLYGKILTAQSFAIFPFRPEAKFYSLARCDSTFVNIQNTIAANFVDGKFSVLSNTKAFEDILTHAFELSINKHKLSMQCHANALAYGIKIRNQAEASAGASEIVIKIETNADHYDKQVFVSLLTASVDVNGLTVNNNANVKLLENEANHKATLRMNKDGLTTSGATILQSPLFMENTFSAGLDASKARLSTTNKVEIYDIKVNNANTMTITLSSFDFNSEARATANDHASYNHDITVDLKPYSASANINNDFEILAAKFINEAQLKAELHKVDLTGSLKAISGQDELKHAYQVTFADMTTNAKCSTTGKLFGTLMNQDTELEVAGLAARITNAARFNSQSMRFDHSIRCSIIPFDFNIDAIFNADGDITMYGKHSGQLYGKFLLRAQPLAFASSHECRASVTQAVDSFSLETTFDSKMNTVLSPQEQEASFRIKSKINEHALNQGLSVYNTAERSGIEVSSTILTNILNRGSTENQEFSVSAFLKYDKNTHSHLIQFPGNLPALLESIKSFVVLFAETLQEYINDETIRDKLEGLPQHVSDFVTQLNIEGKVIHLKQHFIDFTQEYITMEDLEASLSNLFLTVDQIAEHAVIFFIRSFNIMQTILSDILPETLIEQIAEQLEALDKKYGITNVVLYVLDTLGPYIEFYAKIVMNPKYYIMEVIKDHDFVGKINRFDAKIRELIVQFKANKKVEVVLEKAVELIKQFKIEDTIKAIEKIVKDADISTTFMQVLQGTIKYLKSTEVRDIIEQINMFIKTTVKKLNSLNYNDFVDHTNNLIADCTSFLNELIRRLEIPQRLEATVGFLNLVLSSARSFTEHVREIKLADMIKSVQDTINEVVADNIKGYAEFIKEEIMQMNPKDGITLYLDFVRTCITIITSTLNDVVEMIKDVAPEQKIISEIEQIVNGLSTELKKAELTLPSFTIPFTDLVVPSTVFSIDKLEDFEMPTQLDIPEFSILGINIVKAFTISFKDIKQIIIELIDLIVNFEITIPDVDAFFGDLTMNYFPSMPEITFPEIIILEISFPKIPKVALERHFKSLQVPEVKLPNIPSEILVPCFGKLYGEIKFLTPIYTVKASAEFQNSTENKMTPQFTGSFHSQATSHYKFLNYKVDSTTRIAIPKRSRVVLAETLKFNHFAFGLEHQASVSLYGRSAQGQAKTMVKVTTTPYTANIVNTAFVAVEGGMSASLDTTYSHVVDLPNINVKSEATVTQKSVARQDGLTLTVRADTSGTGNVNAYDGNHKSNLDMSLTPSTATLTFSGDTDSTILKMKQQITAEFGTLSYFKFNVRNEAEAPVIKNSLLVASGHASIYDMKLELKANHHTELYDEVSGILSNRIDILVHPVEFIFEFKNKGNVKINILKSLNAKIDLQKDYSAIFRRGIQQMNTITLARFNQYKMFYNFTVENNQNEAGIFFDLESATNLDFLKTGISIPEIHLPSVDFHTPAIIDFNLYEDTGLNKILITTEQTTDVDAKMVYKKSQADPLVDMMGLIQIPYVGNLITELSFKSTLINMNANAELNAEDDIVFRLGVATASVFESLNAKLLGTSSLTTKRGFKLANSLSLENRHIEGTHDSTVSLSTETFETAVSTLAKIALPIFNMETNQNLVLNTNTDQTKANAVSNFRMKGDFNIPVINAVGKAEGQHTLKVEGTLNYLAMESTTRANMDGTVLKSYLILGVLDKEANLYMNNNVLRATSKATADTKLMNGNAKVISMNVNKNVDIEVSLSRVFAVLRYMGNNEAQLFSFNTNGKHIAQATISLAPTSSLTANIEIDISQPSSLGDLTITAKSVADVEATKQKIFTIANFVSPLYITNLTAEIDGNCPIFKVTFKSSAHSAIELFDYDMDASAAANFEDEALNIISKAALIHADLKIDVRHVIMQALRKKRQAENSANSHTLNVDITSPTFTDVHLHYAADRDGISTSVSNPLAGSLGLQFNGPSQINARFYGRYPSAPEVDVDILVIKTDADKMNLQIVYNMEAPKEILSELKMRALPIVSALPVFADKYQITTNPLTISVVNRISEAYDAVIKYDIQMSQLSVFFRNTVGEYQKTIQAFLDAVVNVLRETKFKLPGSDEMTTMPEVLKKVTKAIVDMLDMTIQIIVDNIRNVELHISDETISGDQILDQAGEVFKNIYQEFKDFLQNMESLDTILEKVGETLKAVVEKSQELVDSVKSDYLDAVFVDINEIYRNLITQIKNPADQIYVLNMENLKNAYEYVMNLLIYVVDQFNNTIDDVLLQFSEEIQAYVKVSEGKLEIAFPF